MPTEPGSERAPDSTPATRRRFQWSNPFVLVGVMIAAFFAISLYDSIVAYYNLTIDGAHAYDLSIFQQAFSSTVHGYRVPFYESTDCIMKGRCSFLIVHPSFILYPLAPFYLAFPSPITLFVIRSAAVALAALPLYWLTRQVTGSTGKALLAAGLFLLWSPTLSGDLYSFHVESFIPLELFTMVALWQAGRYRWGLLAASLAFITIEAAPIFTFLIGVFFLFPEIETALRSAWVRWTGSRGTSGRVRGALRATAASVRSSLRQVNVRYSIALLVASVLAYVLVNLFLNEIGAGLLGLPHPIEPGGLAGFFYNNSQNGTTGNVSDLLTSPAFVVSIEYWVILYALVGFLPLLNPRSFVIVGVPWIAYTMLNIIHRFSTLSSQYTMLAAVPVFIGLAYGLARVDFQRPMRALWSSKSKTAPDPGPPPAPTIASRRRRRVTSTWALVFGVIIAANLVINPMVPLIPDTVGIPAPKSVFGPYYFEPWLTVQPGFQWVESLVGLIPASQSVAVPFDLFPLVANNIHAYRLSANPPNLTGLSFNISAGPDWVLVTPALVDSGGRPLEAALENQSMYELRAYVATTTVGPILLFERGFDGVPELFGPQLSQPYASSTASSGLSLGRAGVRLANDSAPGGFEVATNATAPKAGPVCSVSEGFLPPGTYQLTVDVERLPPTGTVNATTRVFELRLLEFDALSWETNLTVSSLPLGNWTTLSFEIPTGVPLVNAEVDFQWVDVHAPFAVASVSLDAPD
jgi:uncharacterized membrane protein